MFRCTNTILNRMTDEQNCHNRFLHSTSNNTLYICMSRLADHVTVAIMDIIYCWDSDHVIRDYAWRHLSARQWRKEENYSAWLRCAFDKWLPVPGQPPAAQRFHFGDVSLPPFRILSHGNDIILSCNLSSFVIDVFLNDVITDDIVVLIFTLVKFFFLSLLCC